MLVSVAQANKTARIIWAESAKTSHIRSTLSIRWCFGADLRTPIHTRSINAVPGGLTDGSTRSSAYISPQNRLRSAAASTDGDYAESKASDTNSKLYRSRYISNSPPVPPWHLTWQHWLPG